MNKVMVVKKFSLRGFDDVRQKPQKYIVKLKKVKAAVVIACDAGERIIKHNGSLIRLNALSFI